MFFFLILLFTVVPMLELYILIRVGQHIGALNTLMIVFAIGILGAFLARLEGLRVLYSVQKDLQEGRIPTSRILDGFLIFAGAIFLIFPGFLTDIIGIILIIPFTRFLVKIWLKWQLQRMIDRKQGVINIRSFRY